jgi:DNA-binding IclR family transcriptional regulator
LYLGRPEEGGVNEIAAGEHRTVSRVALILETIAQSDDGVRLADLMTVLDAPKSSVHALVKGLVATGYVEEGVGGYRLGPAVDLLLRPGRPSVRGAAREALGRLQRACDETSMLCMLVGDSVVYVDLVESTQLIRYAAPLNTRRPIYPTSSGKCFLAYFSDKRRDSYLAANVSHARVSAIHKELAAVRNQGYALNRGETVPDVFAIASPVLVSGSVAACLAVAGPRQRMESKLDQVASHLVEEASGVALASG